MIKNINTLFVTMFGIGKLPKVPGIFGSLPKPNNVTNNVFKVLIIFGN